MQIFPREFSIERSIDVDANEECVFDLISTLRCWELWHPNGSNDASIQRTYGGPPKGKGATCSWQSRRSGAGTMEVTNATRTSEVIVAVVFERPFKLRNVNTFRLLPSNSATRVVWSMRGPRPMLAKLLGLIVNVDKALAAHFDTGLASLKAVAQNQVRDRSLT